MHHHSRLSLEQIGVDFLLSRIVVSYRYLLHLLVGIVLYWYLRRNLPSSCMDGLVDGIGGRVFWH